MFSLPDTVAIQSTVLNAVASGNAAVITLNAVTNNYHVLDWLVWSYADTPTNGNILVHDVTNNTDLLSADITTSGPGGLFFSERGMRCPRNSAITVTLADGSVNGKLTIQYR